MGRSFANLHIKSSNLEKTIEALSVLSEDFPEVLGRSSNQESEDTKSIDSPSSPMLWDSDGFFSLISQYG